MANRTYDWNGHTNLPISYPDLSDFHMAGKVRMLMRSDLDHEGVVCGARDRIMCLSKERANLVVALNEMVGCLSEGKPFVFDPATNFCHADDGGAPEHGIRYAPTEVTGWHPMETAPLDGKHCIIAVQEGAFIYSVQGSFDGKRWNAVHAVGVKPLCWMPNVRLPSEFLPASFQSSTNVASGGDHA